MFEVKTGVHTNRVSAVQYSFKLNNLILKLFQRCQKQINRNFNFRGYKGPQKLKTAHINPYVFGTNPRKFGDAKIFQLTVLWYSKRVFLSYIVLHVLLKTI